MNYNDFKTCHKLTKSIVYKAMNIFYQIKYNIITTNSYYDIFIEDINGILKPKKGEILRLNTQDKIVLALYLSFLKITTDIKLELNNIGIKYNNIVSHLKINIINGLILSEKEYKKIYDNYFAKIFNLIILNDDNIFNINYRDKDFYKLIYDSIYESYIVESNIIEKSLLDMELYYDYIASFNVDANEIDELNIMIKLNNILNNLIDQNKIKDNNNFQKVKVIDINSIKNKRKNI